MTWEVVKFIGNLFSDDSPSSRNSRNRRTIPNRTNDNTVSAPNSRQQKPPSLAPASPKIPSSPVIRPAPILRTTSSSSTIRTTTSLQFTATNDDVLTQQLTEENE